MSTKAQTSQTKNAAANYRNMPPLLPVIDLAEDPDTLLEQMDIITGSTMEDMANCQPSVQVDRFITLAVRQGYQNTDILDAVAHTWPTCYQLPQLWNSLNAARSAMV